MKVLFALLLFCYFSHASTLHEEYEEIKREAIQKAGTPSAISNRIQELKKIYIDSNRRHSFALIAAHGAKWAEDFFSITDPMIDLSTLLLSSTPVWQNFVRADLRAFSLKFQKANRQVFIDTYTNYYFTKSFGLHPDAKNFVNEDLLRQLNLIHQGRPLDERQRKRIFVRCLQIEQETMVEPAIEQAIQELSNQWLLGFVLSPKVRFDYFPRGVRFKFEDFSDERERIYYAIKAYDLAETEGWPLVEASL